MEINDFIEKFRSQLEDDLTILAPETNYVNSDFWDSLTAMVIKVMIEDEYNMDIPVEKLDSFSSIQELFEHIKSTQ